MISRRAQYGSGPQVAACVAALWVVVAAVAEFTPPKCSAAEAPHPFHDTNRSGRSAPPHSLEQKRWFSGAAMCGGPASRYGQAGNFSVYVFQQTWAAGYCAVTHSSSCAAPTEFMRSNLIVHGVWPTYDVQRDGHVGPQCCDSPFGQFLTAHNIANVRDELTRNWPGMGKAHDQPHGAHGAHGARGAHDTPNARDKPATETGGKSLGLWGHEWAKHGTCSGKNQAHYFGTSLAMQHALRTPEPLRRAIGGTIQRAALLQLYLPPDTHDARDAHDQHRSDALTDADWVGLDCTRAHSHSPQPQPQALQQLVHVTTCWSRDEQSRVPCPEWVLRGSSAEAGPCTDGPIAVTRFPAPPQTIATA